MPGIILRKGVPGITPGMVTHSVLYSVRQYIYIYRVYCACNAYYVVYMTCVPYGVTIHLSWSYPYRKTFTKSQTIFKQIKVHSYKYTTVT